MALGRRLWRFHARPSTEDGHRILFLEGRLDHASTAELEAAIFQHASGAVSTVIVDLSGIDYLSGAALRVFEAGADRLSKNGGRLSLRAPSVAARLALDLAGLIGLVDS